MSERKFYKTTISVVVLSENPYKPNNLGEVYYDITDGDCSGRWNITGSEVLTGKEAAIGLMQQGSDPEFFGLDDDGNDLL